jgi:hypothetical protein
MIHPSHSRKELIEIIEVFQIFQIPEYQELKKNALSRALWSALTDQKYIRPDQEHFFVDDVHGLREFLIKSSDRQLLNTSHREEVVQRVKHLTFYSKSGFSFNGTKYKTINDVIADATYVSHYGDIPAVRRCLKRLNGGPNDHGDPRMPYKIEPIVTKRTHKKLEREKQLKADTTGRFRMFKGPVLLTFE